MLPLNYRPYVQAVSELNPQLKASINIAYICLRGGQN